MPIIEGGVVIQDGVPRAINQFGATRHVRAGESIQTAIDAASAGDVIYIDGGNEYDENLTLSTSGIALVGVGTRGSARITGLATNGTALTIDGTAATVNDVLLVNLTLAGRGTGSGLHVEGSTRRISAHACHFDGGDTGVGALLESAGAGVSVVDTRFIDCQFQQAPTGLSLIGTGGANPVSRTRLEHCAFKHISTVCVVAEFTRSLEIIDCVFGAQEDGTEPTDYLDIDVTDTTGLVSGCRFATATSASATLNIASGVFWVANATEAGWSTARP